MQQRQQKLQELGIRVVAVTFEPADAVRRYITETGTVSPILIDDTRRLYGGYGMHRGRFADIWGFRTWRAYAIEFARGRLPRYSGGDTRQLGGDVLIDPNGIVRFHHVGTGPADRPSVATILKARRPAS